MGYAHDHAPNSAAARPLATASAATLMVAAGRRRSAADGEPAMAITSLASTS
jgi:hypothetical protein